MYFKKNKENNMEVTGNEILRVITSKYVVEGDIEKVKVTNVKPIEFADKNSLIWIKPVKQNKQKIVNNTKAILILSDFTVTLPKKLKNNKCLIKTDNPKFTLIEILNGLFARQYDYAIHPKAIIHPEAKIDRNVYIGPKSFIGNCEISENTRIEGNVFIYDGTVIKRNVIIQAGAVIGSDGFGYTKDSEGNLQKFPHIGNVIIHNNVEIGANTCIDRGALGSTIIGENSKINNLVHIAHNVLIGRNVVVGGQVNISGSTKIGDNVWIGPSSSIRNGIIIENDSIVGMGSVVVKNVLCGETVIGNPAKQMLSIKNKSLL